MFGGFGKFSPLLDGLGGLVPVVEADPLLGESVRLSLHFRPGDDEVLGDGDADPVQQPDHGPLVVIDQLLVDDLERLHAAPFEEALPGGVVLVYAQLQVVYRGEAEAQPLPTGILVGVAAPLLGLERLPQRYRLASGIPAVDPDVPPQVGQHRGGHLAGAEVLMAPRPAREADEVAEGGPHDLGPEYTVLGRASPQRLLYKSREVGRAPRGIALCRMLGV